MSKEKVETQLKHLKIPTYLIDKIEARYLGVPFTQVVVTALIEYMEGK